MYGMIVILLVERLRLFAGDCWFSLPQTLFLFPTLASQTLLIPRLSVFRL